MKLVMAFGLLLGSVIAVDAMANSGTYFCYGEDGSDQTINGGFEKFFRTY